MKSPLFLAPFIAALVVGITRTHNTKAWNKIRVSILIVMGVLSAAVACVMIAAAVTMFSRDIFFLWEKLLYCAVITGMIGLLVWFNISSWKNKGNK